VTYIFARLVSTTTIITSSDSRLVCARCSIIRERLTSRQYRFTFSVAAHQQRRCQGRRRPRASHVVRAARAAADRSPNAKSTKTSTPNCVYLKVHTHFVHKGQALTRIERRTGFIQSWWSICQTQRCFGVDTGSGEPLTTVGAQYFGGVGFLLRVDANFLGSNSKYYMLCFAYLYKITYFYLIARKKFNFSNIFFCKRVLSPKCVNY
jgi:hypothetical protein